MKKLFLVIVSLGIISFVTFQFMDSLSSLASNTMGDEEYYYNKEQFWGNSNMIDASNMSSMNSNTQGAPIDTKTDSITVLVNKDYGLPSDYVPNDLEIPDIAFSFSGYHEKKLMREEASKALEAMFQDAEEAGLSLLGVSGYRSFERQQAIYDRNVERDGRRQADLYSARPGFSEHQTGLAMDISTPSIHNRLDETFAATPEGKWLADHASEYGFIIRYPKDKSEITGYAYEPWHVRYVGKELAGKLNDNGLSLEEYYGYSPSSQIQDASYGTAIDVEEADLEAEK